MTDEDEIFSILSNTCALAGKRNSSMRFHFIENASVDSRPHYRLDAFLTVHTKTFENDRIARCDASCVARTCYKPTRLRYCRSSFSFRCFFDRPVIRYVCVFVLIHFRERFQIDAFLMKTLSVLVFRT